MDVIYLFLRTSLVVALIILLTRVNGLRSFSKMSGFDFAITVANGSLLASVVMATRVDAFWTNMGALVAVFVVQRIVAEARERTDWFHGVIDNSPLLLMRDGEILDENLSKGQITRDDLMGKLRESNALRLQDVRAVVLEATGDVSVLHGEKDIDDILLEGVRN